MIKSPQWPSGKCAIMSWDKKIKLYVVLVLIPWFSKAISNSVVELNEDSWHQVTKGEWMIKFYAPWCPACRSLTRSWSEFADWTHDLGLDGVSSVDVTENPGLSGRFLVTALPTIYHVKDGVFRLYRGARDKDSFISFIEDKKWTDVETVPSWKDPSSPQMALVACFFKASMLLRSVHTTIVHEMGWPSWLSYVVFAVSTIVLGALLGLILVCCIDCIYPAQKVLHGTDSQVSKHDNTEADEEVKEEMEKNFKSKGEEDKEVVSRKRKAKKVD